MPTRDRVPALARARYTYEDIGARPGILPGQRHLIATGLPADGTDVLPVSVLWPAVRSALDEGDALADRALGQRSQEEDVLEAQTGAGGDEDRFDGLVEDLVAPLRKHVVFEHQVLLHLRSAMSEDERDEPGRRILAMEPEAPTRPHPHLPPTPPALNVAAAVFAPIDRLRDRAAGRRTPVRGFRR